MAVSKVIGCLTTHTCTDPYKYTEPSCRLAGLSDISVFDFSVISFLLDVLWLLAVHLQEFLYLFSFLDLIEALAMVEKRAL